MNTQGILTYIFENESKKTSFREIVDIGTSNPVPVTVELHKGENGRWRQDVVLPFSYGETPLYINPSDDMGWDVIIPTETPDNQNLVIVGVVKVHPQADAIPYPNGNVPGNHKLIVAPDGNISDEDKKAIEEYFSACKCFLKPIYIEDSDEENFFQENVEKATLGKYQLGHFKDQSSDGIVVGPTARKQFGAKKFKNNLPNTNRM